MELEIANLRFVRRDEDEFGLEYLVDCLLLLEYHCVLFAPYLGGEVPIGGKQRLRVGMMGANDWEGVVLRADNRTHESSQQ